MTDEQNPVEDVYTLPETAVTHKTVLRTLPIEQLVPASWNYKTDGTEDEINKLRESIRRDGSCGVFAIRKIELAGDVKYEVVDGNHRLKATALEGWTHVPCEDFGDISLAQAVTISRRRNHEWFASDNVKLAELYRDHVLPEYDANELATFMPESAEEIGELTALLDFNWDNLGGHGTGGSKEESTPSGSEDEQPKTFMHDIPFKLNNDVYRAWQNLRHKIHELAGIDDDNRIFEIMVIECLNLPAESYQK